MFKIDEINTKQATYPATESNDVTLGKKNDVTLGKKMAYVVLCLEIINNTGAGIVIFFQLKKGNTLLGGKFKFRLL